MAQQHRSTETTNGIVKEILKVKQLDYYGKIIQPGEERTRIATERIDSLIASNPDSDYYQDVKFKALSGIDNEGAYKSLAWILKNREVSNYDWYHLIYHTYAYAEKPGEFALAHEVADRAIEQEGPNSIKRLAMLEKARIFIRQGEMQQAIDLASKALENAKKDSLDPAGLAYFEKNLHNIKNWGK
jgi:tetratricopeptide (TPR) repeat protein